MSDLQNQAMRQEQLPISVMVVDDSAVIRGMITREIELDARIKVVSSAMNGRYAIEELNRKPVDIILLDIEMPEMDGLTALPELIKISPETRILVISNLTQKGAETTLTALELGASDCIGKPSNQRDKGESATFFTELKRKILALASPEQRAMPAAMPAKPTTATPAASNSNATSSHKVTTSNNLSMKKCDAIAIGSSTGGPQALIELFKQLPNKSLSVPVFITQHMPATFTKTLANHISEATGLPCKEAEDGEVALNGHIYVAPGDYHMVVKKDGMKMLITLNQEPPVNFCRPSVDPMFESLAGIYGQHLLAIILTGMGQDGMHGSRFVHERNGKVVIQERESCVVWGMPKAVHDANLQNAEMLIPEISKFISRVAS